MNRHLCLAVCLVLGAAQFAFARKPQRKAAPKPPPVEEPAEEETPTGEEEAPEEPGEPASVEDDGEAESLLEPPPTPDEPAQAPAQRGMRRDVAAPSPPVPAGAAAPGPARPGESFGAAPVEAAAPRAWASERGYRWLEKIAGPEVLELLSDRGYLVTYKLAGTPHLAHVQWELLEPLVRRAPALLEAQAAIGGYRRGRVPDGQEKALRAVLELPSIGLSTPRIRSAASVLLDLLAERRIAGSLPLPQMPFASRPWARDFVRRYNVTELRDPTSLADPYFLELLCAPSTAASAQADLQAEIRARYGNDVSATVERDTKAGQLSDELRGWIMKYLDDNRHALRLVELPADFAALFQSNRLQRELAELRLAADALSKDPAFLDVLRAALSPGGEPAETVRVTLGPLHVHSPTHSDAYDPGDHAELSAAYWLDGLKKGQSVAVEELVFVDRGVEGVWILSDRQRTLGPGGPYTLAVKPDVKDGRPFAVRVVLHAAGAGPTHRDENVSPSPAVDQSLASLGLADRHLAACRLKDAVLAYDALAAEAASRAGRGPFERLSAELRPRQKRASAALNDYEELQSLLEPIRIDASSRECAFSTARGEKARHLLRRLPAGCSLDLAPEVNVLLAAAAQRRRDQDTFWKAVGRARKLEQSCQHALAAERYAAGLAVLDADTAAKCGSAEAEYKQVQSRELPAALAGDAIREDFDRQLQSAADALEKGDAAQALGTLNPLLARLGAQSWAACYEPQRKRAEELADKGGAALGTGPMALARVPDSVDGPLAAVTRERDRRRAEEEARKKREFAQQAPEALDELPGVPLAAPPVESGEAPASPQAASTGGKPATAREEAIRASRKAAAEAEAAVEGIPEGGEPDGTVLAIEKTGTLEKPSKKAKRKSRKGRNR